SEDVEGRPLFYRFAKADSIKAVPPPLFGDYTSLSEHSDLVESQMSYGIKSLTSSDSKSVSDDFVCCDDSDKSSEVNTNDVASSDSSVKSSEPKPNDSTSCASTSSDLPSFSCTSSDKNENTSRTSCIKNSYFNKKAGHVKKHALSISKLCFVCGSGTNLIKNCNFYEKQMVNKTVGIGVGHVHSRNKVNHPNQFVPQDVLLRTGTVTIPPARPQLVPTGKPKVFAPILAGIDGQLLLSPQQVVLGNHIEKVYTGYPRTIVDLIHLHADDNVADLLTKAFDGPSLMVQDDGLVLFKCSTWTRVFNSPMLHLLRVEMAINSPWIMPILGTKELASPEQKAPDFSSILVKTQSSRIQHPDESLFEAWERYKLLIDRCPNHNMLPVTQIDTFYNDLTLRHCDTINATACGTFMKRHPEECYDLIKSMTAHHNDWDTSDQRTTVGQTQNVYSAGAYQGTLPGNTISNSEEELKGITTRSGNAYQGPTIPTTYSSLPSVVERETKAKKDTVHPLDYCHATCSYFMIHLPSKTAMLSLYMFISMPYTIARAICMHDYDMLPPSHGGPNAPSSWWRRRCGDEMMMEMIVVVLAGSSGGGARWRWSGSEGGVDGVAAGR
nr:reverse transcriptase domain-containing protein [Tanacetum cinerariifolium]